jgi:hypothetical protein
MAARNRPKWPAGTGCHSFSRPQRLVLNGLIFDLQQIRTGVVARGAFRSPAKCEECYVSVVMTQRAGAIVRRELSTLRQHDAAAFTWDRSTTNIFSCYGCNIGESPVAKGVDHHSSYSGMIAGRGRAGMRAALLLSKVT